MIERKGNADDRLLDDRFGNLVSRPLNFWPFRQGDLVLWLYRCTLVIG